LAIGSPVMRDEGFRRALEGMTASMPRCWR
jgi:hypothetical protein